MSFNDKETLDYRTRGGIRVERRLIRQPYEGAVEPLVDALERRRGVLLSSSFEYPGRYTRWDLGFVDPPVMLTARDRDVRIEALNPARAGAGPGHRRGAGGAGCAGAVRCRAGADRLPGEAGRGGDLRGGGAQPAAFRLLGAAGGFRPVQRAG